VKQIKSASDLTGTQRAAVFLISVGVHRASQLLKLLRDNEIQDITLQIAQMKNINPTVVDQVIKEYYELMTRKSYIMEGGIDIARELLNHAKGAGNSAEMMRKLEAKTGNSAFGLFQSTETSNIVHFLQSENPQVAALILGHMAHDRAAEVLGQLKPEFQADVAYRLATMGQATPEIIAEIEEVIRDQMGSMFTGLEAAKGGPGAVADILNEVTPSTEKALLEVLDKKDSKLAEEIKKRMFLFDDIAGIDDKHMQIIITEIDKNDLTMALKGVQDELLSKFMGNMSTRAAEMLKEDMEAVGAVHVKDVDEARLRIIQKIKKLESSGQISTRKVSEDEVIQ